MKERAVISRDLIENYNLSCWAAFVNSCHGAAKEFVCQVCLVYLVTSPDDSDNILTTALRMGCAYNIQKQTKKGTYSIAYIMAESHIKLFKTFVKCQNMP